VNESTATHGGHSYGHLCFSDGIHGGGDEGGSDAYVTGEIGGEVNFVSTKVDVAWHEDDIVIGVGDTLGEELLGREGCGGDEWGKGGDGD